MKRIESNKEFYMMPVEQFLAVADKYDWTLRYPVISPDHKMVYEVMDSNDDTREYEIVEVKGFEFLQRVEPEDREI